MTRPLSPSFAAHAGRLAARALLLSAAACLAPAAASGAPAGPPGDEFYAPPPALLEGTPGSVVWQRPSSPFTTPAGAASATTVIYRSRDVQGRPSFVSGDVLMPPGEPGPGGWPLVAFDHVTTGGADRCAPTRATAAENDQGRMIRSRAIVSEYLRRGIAVARTDYEGLGTPGRHPYLIGGSLARATVDMARAARTLEPTISRRWLAAGHSEGGVAALFTGALAPQLAPELELRGVSALAPVVSMRPLFELGRGIPVPLGALTNLAALVIDGAGTVDPQLDAMYGDDGLSRRAQQRYGHIQERCLGDLARPSSWGGLAPADILGRAGDRAYARFVRVLADNDASTLTFPTGLPVRVDQGGMDPITFRPAADRFVREQRARGTRITYRTYPMAGHTDITDLRYAAAAAADWAAAQLR